jgi:hypothetical protein
MYHFFDQSRKFKGLYCRQKSAITINVHGKSGHLFHSFNFFRFCMQNGGYQIARSKNHQKIMISLSFFFYSLKKQNKTKQNKMVKKRELKKSKRERERETELNLYLYVFLSGFEMLSNQE